ncbi:efflux RND transporter periplasmic adaptor subunit [Rhizorhapis suberifaciens]|uniref:HlyD family secretion protein n=1 Tax=Rhizorhapis suberifaciens TaxID=13656 RepID=A0A840HTD6_9SPHN|nr:efflux RND transporter periplasmic adaptor subunit [Rhizorhapis suberifaciens]MBB4641275.1 HlyD family secretion protein [Rhizorhapis suberifaciens]
MNDESRTITDAQEGIDLHEFLGVKPEQPWKKWAVRGGIGILLLVLVLLLGRCFASRDAAQYATEDLERGNLVVTVSATGNLKPINQVDVGSEQSGLITDVYVDVNDRVVKGQPLATLDTSRLVDTVNQARAEVAAAEAGVGESQATASQTRSNLERLEQVYKLSGGKVPSKTELDAGRADSRRAVAAVRSAQAQVLQARAQLATALTNLTKGRIYSPVTGVVLSRDIEPGQTVAASLNAPVLFTIAEDLSQMELDVDVDEADVGEVKAGQRATFTVDAFPGQTFPARIERVNVGSNSSESASSSSSSSSSSSASTGNVVAYTAVLSVNNEKLNLRPGMTATAEIVTREENNVLLVPNAALRFSPERAARAGRQNSGVTSVLMPPRGRRNRGNQEVTIGRGSKQTIYILDEDGQPQPIQVRVGESNGSQSQVTGKDLKPGMKVVTGQLASGEK